ncbi:curli-like amyloid fiber formation chaperone CsgH [Roseibium suaedae]|uniref:CsgH-like domain-containing protein n=1 Tax=Roseibium suaedae TaxID=735517 RepID=A0A1M7N7X0_9HYPH|nr:curli-like amyloid fiber formation chaperone CsgH [Roseibium suaedae]SHM99661.1 hypothetical protein SAMN05444272_3749 [Roseibium suaedae]
MRIATLTAAAGLTPALAGALAFFAVSGLSAAPSASGAHSSSAACTLETTIEGGMINVTAFAKLPSGTKGPQTVSYRLSVTGGAGSNKTDISQGGQASVPATGRAPLGQLMLSRDGIYDARLQVTIGTVNYHCNETIGGRI